MAERADVRRGEVSGILRGLMPAGTEVPAEKRIDLILYDPPFVFSRERNSRAAMEQELALAGQFLSAEGRLVLRCERITEPPRPAGLTLTRHWQDGPHALCFYARQAATP